MSVNNLLYIMWYLFIMNKVKYSEIYIVHDCLGIEILYNLKALNNISVGELLLHVHV